MSLCAPPAVVFAALVAAHSHALAAQNVSVDSSKVVNATGVQASKGQKLSIRATGAVNLSLFDGPYDTDPNGTIVVAPPPGSGSYNFFTTYAAPVGVPPAVGNQKLLIPPYQGQLEGAAYGALVAGFSANPSASSLSDFPDGFTLVGASSTVTAPIDGYLFLAVNDFNNTYDNSGSFSAVIGCQVDPSDITRSLANYNKLDGQPTSMRASFTPSSSTLDFLASKCDFQGFDWVQTVEILPDPSAFYQANGTHLTSASTPFSDPPLGGYTYAQSQMPPYLGAYPFVYNPVYIPFDCAEDYADGTCYIYIRPILGNTINFSDTPKNPCLFGGDWADTYHCNFDTVLSGPPSFTHFKTALVGILDTGKPSDPLYEWTWKDNFNGNGLGGVIATASADPADPGSGTGGVTITSINGVPQTPPSVSCAATPNTLWPPNGQSVLVTVLGVITPGTSALVSGGTTYAVVDEYGQVQPNGSIALGVGGNYSFGVSLIAARNGNDKDGRTYTIMVHAVDQVGNVGSCVAVVTVPHDQR